MGRSTPTIGDPLPEFAGVRRYMNRDFDRFCVTIKPGEFYVTPCQEGVVTVLGSCIAACIRDRVFGIGGMNHFMLPINHRDDVDQGILSDANRYGNFAMENLVNSILRNGGNRKNLEAKVFGGGRILANMSAQIGTKNVQFAFDYLKNEGIPIVAHDVEKDYPRKVAFFPITGEAYMREVPRSSTESVKSVEKVESSYIESLKTESVADGEIDLFD